MLGKYSIWKVKNCIQLVKTEPVWLVEPGFELEVGFQFFQRIRTNQDQDPNILIEF
jgi:hypothetical protein